MRLLWAILLAVLGVLAAPSIKLYLKDGSHQVVREYKVETDRVRYYSLERSEWEEVPLDLVDLKRTTGERSEREASHAAERKAVAEEDAAEREHLARIARIPEAAGAYWEDGSEMKPLVLAESALVTDKKRTILKVMSPVPLFAGKATVEIAGENADRVFAQKQPEFFLRLSADENFALIQLQPGRKPEPKSKDPVRVKGSRIVERVTIDPMQKDLKYEEPQTLEIFRQQLGDRLFRIWPQVELKPGEYAVIQFTPGKVNPQVWDFAIR